MIVSYKNEWIIDYFPDPYDFEQCACKIAQIMDSNIIQITPTRRVRDGGRDANGKYRVGNLSNGIELEFALEAKRYKVDDSVGVKETSRLISRIKNRQFGIIVTTSYVGDQAYKEIIEELNSRGIYVENFKNLSDTAKCYVGFIDLSGEYYTTDEEVPLSWSNSTDPTKGVQFNMSSRFAANGGSAPLTIRLVNPHIRLRTPKKYRITQSLDHCSSSYISTTISEMITKQKITFTPDTGYVMESFKVTMNGVELPYSYVDGNSIVINTISGNINIEATAVEVVEFDGVNMIPMSVDHDGSIFNEVGYMTNKRVDYSTGDVIDAVATVPNSSVTGFIPFAPGDILYFYRVPFNISKNVGEINILLYEEDKVTKVNNVNPSDFISRLGGSCPGIASDPKSCFIYFADEKSQMFAIAFNPNSTSSMVAKTKWIRITTTELLDEYSIISKNQPITNITHYNVRVAGENCSFTNGTSTITQFNPFTTKVVPNENCVLVGINVIMNGQDVTAWYVKDNTVNIPYVYGDVVITANVNKVATEDVEDIDITYSKNTRLSQSSGNQTAYDGAVATNRIDISRVPKPCYLDMTGVAWAANSAAVHNRIVYSMDLMCGLRSNGYTGTNGSTNADYNDALNISNIERKNDTNTDITITITDPGISTIAFSGYTGTDAAGDGFTGQGNMDDANIHIWYKPEESVSYDFSGNLLEGVPVEYNKRWSASSGTLVDSNGILVLKVPMSVALGKQFKLTGFNSSMTSVDGQPSTFYVQPDEISAGASKLAMKPLWTNANCADNGDGTYTINDMLGGYYEQRAGYGSLYAMEGVFEINADGTIVGISGNVAGWGDSMDSLDDGTYDEATKTISWKVVYAGMDFYVTMNK